MSRLAKKEHERAAVSELLKWLGIVDAEVSDRESPDFEVFAAEKGRFAIEVVELADPSIAAGQAALKALEKDLADALRSRGLTRGVHLSVGEGGILFAPREVRARHVKAITELVNERSSRRGAIDIGNRALASAGAEFVLKVMVNDSGFVTIGSSATGRRQPFVQGCIDAKNAKVSEYRASLGAGQPLWLLLLTGIAFRSGIWSVVVEDHEYISDFDRTFCIDAFENKFIEVKTRTGAHRSSAKA